jgi:quercetin dioxygenase-like cupin family protein
MQRPRLLASRTHTIFRLSADLLLVFKPRGHREDTHAHPYRQRLLVLRGRLRVHAGTRAITLRPASPPFTLAAGRLHDTLALEDTWLVARSIRTAASARGAAPG